MVSEQEFIAGALNVGAVIEGSSFGFEFFSGDVARLVLVGGVVSLWVNGSLVKEFSDPELLSICRWDVDVVHPERLVPLGEVVEAFKAAKVGGIRVPGFMSRDRGGAESYLDQRPVPSGYQSWGGSRLFRAELVPSGRVTSEAMVLTGFQTMILVLPGAPVLSIWSRDEILVLEKVSLVPVE